MDPDDVPRLFSVNRTLVSSKQLRLPTRGMVGNGLRVVMGAIAAFEGNLTVTTRGRHMRLAVDRETGLTDVTEDTEVPFSDGMTVFISLPGGFGYPMHLARETARIAEFGRAYEGPTSPHWYAARDLRDLMQQAPEETTVADVADWFGIDLPDERFARDLDPLAAAELLSTLRLFVPLCSPPGWGRSARPPTKIPSTTRSTGSPAPQPRSHTCAKRGQHAADQSNVVPVLPR